MERYFYYPAADVGTHTCGPRRLEHWSEAGKKTVTYYCRTDNRGPVPVCGGLNPEWPAAWDRYQAYKHRRQVAV